MPSSFIVVMGVSGCGKSTIGQGLADKLEVPYVDADSLHPKFNVEKMSNGTPLTDADRAPWLHIVRAHAIEACREGPGKDIGVVVACSALRRAYRDLLRGLSDAHVEGDVAPHEEVSPDDPKLDTYFVFINGPRDLLFERMTARKNHFMKGKMLDSQIATLEDPTGEDGVVPIRLEDSVEDQLNAALDGLHKLGMPIPTHLTVNGVKDHAKNSAETQSSREVPDKKATELNSRRDDLPASDGRAHFCAGC